MAEHAGPDRLRRDSCRSMSYDSEAETISGGCGRITQVLSSSSEHAPGDASVPRPGRGNAAQPRTTLALIAAEAGVSLPTVSKVVNGRPDVAPATRARVEQLLDQHQYARNGLRRHRRAGLLDGVF